MKISELINDLATYKESLGDIEVSLECEYFSGEYGEHTCVAVADIDLVSATDGKMVLSGQAF